MEDASLWGSSFEPFYGREYCLRVAMDLEKIRDEQYQGNSFLFQKGWLVPTVALLQRLRHWGFPVRTKRCILVHLSPPVDTMQLGELYLQVGRQLPGRLSLKFTRRQPDGRMVIQPTVLEADEEHSLSANPCRYLDTLRDTGRLTQQQDADRLLTTLVVLGLPQCERQRVSANTFLQSLHEPSNVWFLRRSPSPTGPLRHSSFDVSNESLPHLHYPPPPPNYPAYIIQQQYQPRHHPDPCSSMPPNFYSPPPIFPKQRSGSEGNIVVYNGEVSQQQHRYPHQKVNHQRHPEPEEDDETNPSSGTNGTGGTGDNKGKTSRYSPRPAAAATEEYAGTEQGVLGIGGCAGHNPYDDRRRSSGAADAAAIAAAEANSGGRTSQQEDYAGVAAALSSLSVSSSPSPYQQQQQYQRGVAATRRGSSPCNDNHSVYDEYAPTKQAFGGGGGDVDCSWSSHQDLDSHATYHQQLHFQHHHHQQQQSSSSMLPLSVEELNRLAEVAQDHKRNKRQH